MRSAERTSWPLPSAGHAWSAARGANWRNRQWSSTPDGSGATDSIHIASRASWRTASSGVRHGWRFRLVAIGGNATWWGTI